MLKRRYEILLPRTFNDGQPVPEELFRQTKEELIMRFGGLTVAPGSVEGIWVHEGVRYEDVSLRLTVDVEDIPECRQFFVDWKPTLRERFKQIEIYITSTPVDVI